MVQDMNSRVSVLENQVSNHEEDMMELKSALGKLTDSLTENTKALNKIENYQSYQKGSTAQNKMMIGAISSGIGGTVAIVAEMLAKFIH